MERGEGKNLLVLKYLLIFFAVYHILLGLGGIFVPQLVPLGVELAFNFKLQAGPEPIWIIGAASVYLLVFGIIMLVASTDPLKYEKIIYAAILLIAIRVIQRLIFVFQGERFFAGDPIRNWIGIAIVSSIGTTMFILLKRAK